MPEWQEEYPAVHQALAPEYRDLPRERVETIIGATFGEGIGLDEAEGIFDAIGKTLGNVARAVAPVVQRALPGVLSGAAGGAALGPLGAIGGALLGGIGGALGGGRRPARPAVSPRTLAPAAVPGAGPAGAIGQLFAALGSPTVHQALNSMMLGRAGSRSVPTPGGTQLPVAAVTSLLGMLANRASAEWEELVPAGEAEAFEAGPDPVAPEARAEWALGQLAPVEFEPESGAGDQEGSGEEGWLDELYDEFEAELLGVDGEAAYDEGLESEDWSLAANG
jgi:hypothetical protein